VERSFRQDGWTVYTADSGPEARRLAGKLPRPLVVLEADLPDESGWLTCAKLLEERPGTQVILVGPITPRNRAFAAFVGAARLVSPEDGVEALLDRAVATAVPA
jgi:DNA-binding response OmpR family regulator